MIKLGVNIDHVATIRQARMTVEPDPVAAAAVAELAGADGITVHLREDRRHMQDRDVEILRKTVRSRLNLEMAVAEEIVCIAENLVPDQATLVPEKREEVTTEGGLDIVGGFQRVKEVTQRLQDKGIVVSLFIDPEEDQIVKSKEAGAEFIEFHTGAYAEAWGKKKETAAEMERMKKGIMIAKNAGLRINAGHGLTYQNVEPIAMCREIHELNIGHSIISRAVLSGLKNAVKDMKDIIRKAYASGDNI
jgi:pyridoxine 5-phosphate synthase